jgi:hypothetical protein
MKKVYFIFPMLIIFLLTGCMTPPKFIVPGWQPGRIAILPFMNNTEDEYIDEFARVLLHERLKQRKFDVIDLEKIDEALEYLGIPTDGLQRPISPMELNDVIPADSYLYGTVLQATRVMAGIYFEKTFEADYMIMDGQTGQTMWQDDRIGSEKKISLNPKNIVKGIITEMAEELTTDIILNALAGHPLIEQMRYVTYVSVSTLPRPK